MSNQIHKNQNNNVFKTWLYLLFFSLLVGAIGFILATYFNNPIFFWTGSFVSIGMSIYSYWNSSKMVLSMANARALEEGENEELRNSVLKLSGVAGIPMPKIYIINDPSPNAFATGRNPENGVIAFTTGILSLLDKDELEGVISHELSHIVNRDTLLMTVVAVMANVIQMIANMIYYFSPREGDKNIVVAVATTLAIGILAPLAATIVQLAISRKREFLADESGALLSRNPKGLARALEKIEKYPFGMQDINPSISHLFISDPEKDTETTKTPWFVKLFMTHPPINERVEILLKMQ